MSKKGNNVIDTIQISNYLNKKNCVEVCYESPKWLMYHVRTKNNAMRMASARIGERLDEKGLNRSKVELVDWL